MLNASLWCLFQGNSYCCCLVATAIAVDTTITALIADAVVTADTVTIVTVVTVIADGVPFGLSLWCQWFPVKSSLSVLAPRASRVSVMRSDDLLLLLVYCYRVVLLVGWSTKGIDH